MTRSALSGGNRRAAGLPGTLISFARQPQLGRQDIAAALCAKSRAI